MEEVAIEAQAAAAATDYDGDELDNLISELLNDDGLLCALATDGFESCNNEAVLCSGAAADQRPAAKRAFSSAYSGPTIRDIEMALSSRYPSARRYTSQYLFGACSRGAEINKHTTKVKSCGGKLPGDGYKWRKYGQKSIKKSPHPRSYYKCTISRCNAKKHVEKSTEDPDTLIVTYEGWHRHHPQPLFPRLQTALGCPLAGGADAACPVAKNKPKTLLSTARRSACDATETTGARTDGATGGQKGLLEDVVPAVVRNPCDSTCSAPCPLMSPSSSSSNSSPANWLLDLPWSPGALLL